MLENIENITYRYLHGKNDSWINLGERGVFSSSQNYNYCSGLFKGMHFHMLKYYLLGQTKRIPEAQYEYMFYIAHEKDELKRDKYEKFILHIIRYMTYFCCFDYIRNCTNMTKKIQIALLKRMVYLLELEK